MRILFYAHFFKPETGAAVVRSEYFVKALRKAGHSVSIVSPKPNYPLGKIFQGFDSPAVVRDEKENITYLPIWFIYSHSPIGRLVSYLSYFFSSLFYLLFQNKQYDVVLTSSPPIFTSLAAFFYARYSHAKLVFDIRDIWPDIGIELGILRNKWLLHGLKIIEKTILDSSNAIIVTAKGDKKNIENKLSKNINVEIIYNGADCSLFKPADSNLKNATRIKYNLPLDKKILVYFGSYNHGMNDINMIGEFLTHTSVAGKDFHFLSIGSGDKLNGLLEKINGKVSFTSFLSLPIEQVAELVAASDISLIPRKNIVQDTGGNIPVKCFESWAAGIPVLMSNIEDTDVTRIFNDCGAGFIVHPDNLADFVDGFEKLINSDIDDLGKKGRNYVNTNFDRVEQSKKLKEILQKI